MHKNLLTLLLLGFFSLSAFAQEDPVLKLPTIIVDEGEEFDIDFTTQNFIKIIAMQFTIKWDSSKAEILEVTNYNLPDLGSGNFGLAPVNTERGWLPMVWDDSSLSGVTKDDDEVLFTLRMKAMGDAGDTVAIWFDNTPAVIQVADTSGEAIPHLIENGEIIFSDLVSIDETVKETIAVNSYPNPFNEYTFINFDIKETTDLTLTITDISGRQIYATEETMNKGFHQLKIDAAVFPSPGEYFYYIRTNEYQLFKKLIFVK